MKQVVCWQPPAPMLMAKDQKAVTHSDKPRVRYQATRVNGKHTAPPRGICMKLGFWSASHRCCWESMLKPLIQSTSSLLSIPGNQVMGYKLAIDPKASSMDQSKDRSVGTGIQGRSETSAPTPGLGQVTMKGECKFVTKSVRGARLLLLGM